MARIRALGLDPADVTDIVLTHLDLDHAGGLADFPQARVHVYDAELDGGARPADVHEKGRYVEAQWAHGPQWVRHQAAGDEWLGFSAVTALGDDVVLVPLHGHSRGHMTASPYAGPTVAGCCTPATPTSTPARRPRRRTCPPTLRAFQTIAAQDNEQRHANQDRLRELHAAHSDELTVFCAHDAERVRGTDRSGPLVGADRERQLLLQRQLGRDHRVADVPADPPAERVGRRPLVAQPELGIGLGQRLAAAASGRRRPTARARAAPSPARHRR